MLAGVRRKAKQGGNESLVPDEALGWTSHADNFDTMGDSPELTSRVPFALVPSDSVPLTQVVKGIYVGTGGDVTLRGVGGASDVTYRNLPNASYIGVRASFVRATGTTATDLIGEA